MGVVALPWHPSRSGKPAERTTHWGRGCAYGMGSKSLVLREIHFWNQKAPSFFPMLIISIGLEVFINVSCSKVKASHWRNRMEPIISKIVFFTSVTVGYYRACGFNSFMHSFIQILFIDPHYIEILWPRRKPYLIVREVTPFTINQVNLSQVFKQETESQKNNSYNVK